MTMNKDELNILKKLLEKLLKELQQKGMVESMSETKMNDLIDNVVNKLSVTNLKKNDLSNATVLKALKLSLVAEFYGKKFPSLQFDYSKLFVDHLDKNTKKPELQNELHMELKKLFTALNKNPDPSKQYPEERIDAFSKNLAAELTNHFFAADGQKMLAENESVLQGLSEMYSPLAMSLRSEFGGIDPRYPGGGQFVAVATIVGLLPNIVGTTGHETGAALIDRTTQFSEMGDPNGTKNFIFQNLEAFGSEIGSDLIAKGDMDHIKPKSPISTDHKK